MAHVEPDGTAVVRQPAQQELQQGGLPAAGGTGEGVLAALLELEGQVLQDGLFTILEAEVLHSDRAVYLSQFGVSLGLGIICVDGDFLKIGLGGGEGQQELRHIPQTVGETSAQVAAAHQGTLEDHALDGQHTDQDVDQHLADDIDTSNPCADKALHVGQPKLGVFDLVAGRIRALAEPLLPAKEAQNIIPSQKIFQLAGSRRLLLGAGAAQLFHPLIEQLGDKQHNHSSQQRGPQQ